MSKVKFTGVNISAAILVLLFFAMDKPHGHINVGRVDYFQWNFSRFVRLFYSRVFAAVYGISHHRAFERRFNFVSKRFR
ncbi:MAG: hypothetical protein ACTHML_21225 [Ginsengibacter sp.]